MSAFIFRYDKQEPVTVAGDIFTFVIDSIDALGATQKREVESVLRGVRQILFIDSRNTQRAWVKFRSNQGVPLNGKGADGLRRAMRQQINVIHSKVLSDWKIFVTLFQLTASNSEAICVKDVIVCGDQIVT